MTVGLIEKIWKGKIGYEHKSEFALARIAVLNNFGLTMPKREELLKRIRLHTTSSKKLKTSLSKQYRSTSANTAFGPIPLQNLLLICDNTSSNKEALIHLCMSYPSLPKKKPKDPFLHLLGASCKECGGTLKPNLELGK
jgi:hypothetical protein